MVSEKRKWKAEESIDKSDFKGLDFRMWRLIKSNDFAEYPSGRFFTAAENIFIGEETREGC